MINGKKPCSINSPINQNAKNITKTKGDIGEWVKKFLCTPKKNLKSRRSFKIPTKSATMLPLIIIKRSQLKNLETNKNIPKEMS